MYVLLTWAYRCGHCKALAPHYEEAATTLKEKGIKLAKVNCVDEADFCQSNGVQGYPYVYFTSSPCRLALVTMSRTIALFVCTAMASTPTMPVPARLMASLATW